MPVADCSMESVTVRSTMRWTHSVRYRTLLYSTPRFSLMAINNRKPPIKCHQSFKRRTIQRYRKIYQHKICKQSHSNRSWYSSSENEIVSLTSRFGYVESAELSWSADLCHGWSKASEKPLISLADLHAVDQPVSCTFAPYFNFLGWSTVFRYKLIC